MKTKEWDLYQTLPVRCIQISTIHKKRLMCNVRGCTRKTQLFRRWRSAPVDQMDPQSTLRQGRTLMIMPHLFLLEMEHGLSTPEVGVRMASTGASAQTSQSLRIM
jgi:hypothetical protein